MRRGGKAGRYGLVVLLGCLAAGPLAAQQPQPPDAARVEELFAQARPHLEAALGARLERVPQFRLLTAEEFRRLPDPELEATLFWLFPQLKREDFRKTAEVVRFVAAAATVARHLEGSDAVCVLPANGPVIARWDTTLQAAGSPAFLQLALVHETARFVLEKRHDLARRRRACRDPEEFLALQALTEGRAAWLTYQVARRLGSEAQFVPLAERYLRVPDLAPDPALRTMSHVTLRQRHWAAVCGFEFFDHLQQRGLPDAEKVAFARPPQDRRRVERPDAYLRGEQSGRTDLASALRTLADTLPAADWAAAQQPWTPEMVRQVAGLLGRRAQAERAVAAWDEGRSLVWMLRRDPRKQLALSLARHESEAGARSYFGFAVDLQRKQDEVGGGACAPAVRVLESRATALKLPGYDEAVRNDKRMQYGAGGEPVAVSTLLARSGKLVVECSWHGLAPDDDWATRVAAAALAACRDGR
jgi:hypothetical protein